MSEEYPRSLDRPDRAEGRTVWFVEWYAYRDKRWYHRYFVRGNDAFRFYDLKRKNGIKTRLLKTTLDPEVLMET